MKSRGIIIIIFTIAALHISKGQVLPELITDRPDATESASTVEKGMLQLETGYEYAKLTSQYGDEEVTWKDQVLNTTLLRFGLTSFAELRIGGDWMSSTTTHTVPGLYSFETVSEGYGPMAIGAKFALLKEDGLFPDLALILETDLPCFATEEVKPDDPAYGILVAGSHTLGESLGVGYNIGGSFEGDEWATLRYSIAFGYGLNEKLACFAEVFGEHGDGALNSFAKIDGGFTYMVCPALQLDLYSGIDVGADDSGWMIGGGLSYQLRMFK